MNEVQTTKPTATQRLKATLNSPSVAEQFQNAMGENATLFTASIVEIFTGDTYLQKCNPNDIVMECLKAATLKLPINKNLGFAWIIPYKDKPQFQIGYKGYIQLAMRTGKYKTINADVLYEGQIVDHNYLTGEFKISGEPTSDVAIGYFSYFKLLNGFEKSMFWTKARMLAHKKKYSKSANRSSSPWNTDEDAMARKTMLTNLLSKYGVLSIEMANTMSKDRKSEEEQLFQDMQENANQDFIDIEPDKKEGAPPESPEKRQGPKF